MRVKRGILSVMCKQKQETGNIKKKFHSIKFTILYIKFHFVSLMGLLLENKLNENLLKRKFHSANCH